MDDDPGRADNRSVETATPRDPLDSPTRATTWWTTTNLNEAIPGVATPMTWTFWYLPTERNIRRVFHRFGILPRAERAVPPEIDERFLAIFRGRAAANLNVFRRIADLAPGTSGNAYEEQFFGAVRSDVTSRGSRRRYAAVAAKAPTILWRLERRVRDDRHETDQWWRAIVFGAPPRSARELLASGQRHFEHVIYGHGLVTSVVQTLYERLSRACEQVGRPELETAALGGFGSVEESRMVADLWSAASGISTLDEMIRRHGYHGLDEGELSNRVWREARSTVEALINSYRNVSDPSAAEASRREQRLDAQSELLGALPAGRRPGVRLLLRLASRYVPLRETGKASFLQTLDVARFALRHLGAELEASGLLESDDDVFYLTCEEAIAPIPPADARDRVAFRREQRLRFERQPLPNVWQGAPTVVAEPELDSGSPGSVVVSGIGVQPGTITGTARVLDGPASFAELVPGEVLVCHATDPGWTSLFPLASGVVIDVGGTMSHGAIVAREFGIPCVVNTKDGTRRLETGDTVRVDGSSGRVEVLDRVSRESSPRHTREGE